MRRAAGKGTSASLAYVAFLDALSFQPVEAKILYEANICKLTAERQTWAKHASQKNANARNVDKQPGTTRSAHTEQTEQQSAPSSRSPSVSYRTLQIPLQRTNSRLTQAWTEGERTRAWEEAGMRGTRQSGLTFRQLVRRGKSKGEDRDHPFGEVQLLSIRSSCKHAGLSEVQGKLPREPCSLWSRDVPMNSNMVSWKRERSSLRKEKNSSNSMVPDLLPSRISSARDSHLLFVQLRKHFEKIPHFRVCNYIFSEETRDRQSHFSSG